MANTSYIHDVFMRFQNLNLLALLHDLRQEQTMRSRWVSGARLCPLAHGLPAGAQVRELSIREQCEDLPRSCEYAAEHLGASPQAVLAFVEMWDDEFMPQETLLRQLEGVWQERLEDAVALQEVLQQTDTLTSEASRYGIAPPAPPPSCRTPR